ncbi:transcription factor FapR [Gracilibacillus sp. S3-1-1]|uniref:Transcription factor FapR n=1 Tax=Gracilibacillus pellucidus TaxID=3095368 RepID=A0ACC6M8F8_9BACI|nr:transcription factor FapR [Gracilibacillus sp. S3-1-1]MDX8047250.1 transcription factor FapR [Gracilibacillus sp. S3-1-1]
MGKIEKRQTLLKQIISETPFIKDKELARILNVSIQTIRLDRLELSIPEYRERIKNIAYDSQKEEFRLLPIDEVIGELIDLELDNSAVSILEIEGNEHVFSRNQIVRGHYLFAQANSLAIAVINDELALTSQANMRFLEQVKQNDKVIAKAKVKETDFENRRALVEVKSFVNGNIVFLCDFEFYRSNWVDLKANDRDRKRTSFSLINT